MLICPLASVSSIFDKWVEKKEKQREICKYPSRANPIISQPKKNRHDTRKTDEGSKRTQQQMSENEVEKCQDPGTIKKFQGADLESTRVESRLDVRLDPCRP